MKPIDPVQLRAEIKAGYKAVYIKRGKIYITDTANGETILIGEVKEAEERGKYE